MSCNSYGQIGYCEETCWSKKQKPEHNEDTKTDNVTVVVKHNEREVDKISFDGDEPAGEERDDEVESVGVVKEGEEESQGKDESRNDVMNVKRGSGGQSLTKNALSKATPPTQMNDLLNQRPEITAIKPKIKRQKVD